MQANRNPSANGLTMSPQAGFAPLTVTWGGAATDPDGAGHTLTYAWDFTGTASTTARRRTRRFTYTTAGTYLPRVRVSDPFGGSATRTFVVNVIPEARDPNARFRILIFSKTAGFRHSSIDEGIAAIKLLGTQQNIQVDAIEESTLFTDAVLARYDAVVFLSTTSDVLNDAQQAAFERYIQAGHGYAGIHSAADTEYLWPWYGQLVRRLLPQPPERDADRDGRHRGRRAPLHAAPAGPLDARGRVVQLPIAGQSGGQRRRHRLSAPATATPIHVLLTMDESTYSEADGSDGVNDDHPISWCKRYDGGRMWYTGMGHTEASYLDAELHEAHPGRPRDRGRRGDRRACGVTSRSVPSDVSRHGAGDALAHRGPAASFGAFTPGLGERLHDDAGRERASRAAVTRR